MGLLPFVLFRQTTRSLGGATKCPGPLFNHLAIAMRNVALIGSSIPNHPKSSKFTQYSRYRLAQSYFYYILPPPKIKN